MLFWPPFSEGTKCSTGFIDQLLMSCVRERQKKASYTERKKGINREENREKKKNEKNEREEGEREIAKRRKKIE